MTWGHCLELFEDRDQTTHKKMILHFERHVTTNHIGNKREEISAARLIFHQARQHRAGEAREARGRAVVDIRHCLQQLGIGDDWAGGVLGEERNWLLWKRGRVVIANLLYGLWVTERGRRAFDVVVLFKDIYYI